MIRYLIKYVVAHIVLPCMMFSKVNEFVLQNKAIVTMYPNCLKKNRLSRSFRRGF